MISIGLPSYNSWPFIENAVQSILAQSYANWELILIDDGSNDASLDFLTRLARSDSRIRLIADGTNRKLSARLNEVARTASGEYLARMDADDMMHPDRLKMQLQYLLEHPECDLVGSAIVCIDVNNSVMSYRCPAPIDGSAMRILEGEVIYHPTVMGKRDWFVQNPYNTTYPRSQDYELWCRLAGKLTIHNISQPLLFYREYGNFSWAKYKRHSDITKSVIKNYGRETVGLLHTMKLLYKRRLKDLVYCLCCMSGQEKLVLNCRNQKLGKNSIAGCQKIVDKIVNYDLTELQKI